MSLPEPEQVLVAAGDEVEPLLRAARAQIAQLSLQLRSADHEANELEAALSEDDTSGRDLLRAGLDELIESRRHELAQDLEQELARAADVVSAARSEAARIRLTAPPVEPSGGTGARRLQVVADDEGDDPSSDDQPPAELADEKAPPPDPPEPVETAGVDDRAWRAAVPGVYEGAPEPAPAHEAVVAQEQPSEKADAAPRSDPDLASAPLLRELVSAAVTAAVSQALGAVGAARQSPSPVWTDQPTGVNPMLPVNARAPRPPFWRQLLHVDVILPLVLVVIVFVVLLAWVG